jgi:predicted GNAT family N-acyltransferase
MNKLAWACLTATPPNFSAPGNAPILKDFSCPFFVVTKDGQTVACGGYGAESEPKSIELAWGMVRNDLHRQGIGKFLLIERLKLIFRADPDACVVIDTSQHSQDFFARLGFKATNLNENYYAPGLHRVDMELELNDNLRKILADE